MNKKIKILCLLLALNVFLNAFNAFSYCDPKIRIKEIEESAKNIASGKCVLVENVYETTRFLKANVIKYIDKDLDTVIIGSSNMLPYLSKDKTKKYLNLSIGGANLQERLNMLGLLSTYDVKYKNVILEIDALSFRSDARKINTKYKIFDEYGNYFLKLINNENNNIKPNINFNAYYNEENKDLVYIDIKKAFEEREVPREFHYYNKEIAMVFPKMYYPPDKKLLYGIGHISDDAIYGVRLANAGADYVSGSESINKESKIIMDKMINYLKSNGVNIKLVIVPRAPYIYDGNNEKNLRLYKETEEYAKLLSEKYNLKLEGSFDPHKFNLKEDDYYDGFHMFPSVLNELFTY